ncbi:hypothetical protein [Citrobacter farmeri]|nr:hypothetical protein [Citrobacter farmeri]EHK0945543.1 hypothetical protein [Citrobacter farmeri]EKX4539925.1 hypothetical protein [Citrobacter farmeri]MDB2163591.1 hypothetical protein [Citrobacter farmeri]HBC0357065.1 hypothetical protein [Citrobacter farmeri]HBZ8834761.1 hypothetical protein [Citrobacter farmeri]
MAFAARQSAEEEGKSMVFPSLRRSAENQFIDLIVFNELLSACPVSG